GRIGVARADDVGQQLVVSGVTGQRIVTARLMRERADQGDLVHPLAHLRQMLADEGAGDGGADRLKFAANLGGSAELELDHVLGAGAAEQIKQNDVLRPPTVSAGGLLRLQQSRQAQPEGRNRSRLQRLAPRVTAGSMLSGPEDLPHGGLRNAKRGVERETAL